MSAWMTTLQKKIQNKEVIVLFGNVRDSYIGRDGKLHGNLTDFIKSEIRSPSFTSKIFYDIWDQQRIEPASPDAVRLDPSIPPTRPLAEWNQQLKSPGNPTLVTIFYLDKLISQKSYHTADELKVLILLEKIIENIAPTNRLILVALGLDQIPSEIYINSPKVHLQHLPLPDDSDRERYFRRTLERYLPIESENKLKTIVSYTDGLYLKDLFPIAQELRKEGALDNEQTIREIINIYKFGEQEDPFGKLSTEKLQGTVHWFGDPQGGGVQGQSLALKRLEGTLVLAKTKLFEIASGTGSKPKGVFFFAGPSGVGKTMVAKKLSQFLFGPGERFTRFDMSEYQGESTYFNLIGSPKGYISYEEGGLLTNAVRQKPFSVILFDEIEKGHKKILDLFLQILDDGRITDNKGQTVFFSEAVIVFTSNIGTRTRSLNESTKLFMILEDLREHMLIDEEIVANGLQGAAVEEVIATLDARLRTTQDIREIDILNELVRMPDGPLRRSAIRAHFVVSVKNYFRYEISRPELLNRIEDDIIPFNYIDGREEQRKIVDAILTNFTRSFEQQYLPWDFHFEYNPNVSNFLLEKYDDTVKEFGGRKILSIVRKEILLPMAYLVLRAEEGGHRGVTFSAAVNPDASGIDIRHRLPAAARPSP